MKRAVDLSEHDLITVVSEIQGHLYYEPDGTVNVNVNVDKEWDADVLDAIGTTMRNFGLEPE